MFGARWIVGLLALIVASGVHAVPFAALKLLRIMNRYV